MNKIVIEIIGKNVDNYFNILLRKKVNIYNIDKNENKIIITINEKDYKTISKIKTSCKIKVINSTGIIKIRYLLRKYKYTLVLFLIMLIVLYFLSNIIFKVEVIHSDSKIRGIIYEDLKDYGIDKYHFIKKYSDIVKIKKKILKKENNDIEWIEIDRIGTKYIVNVEQRKKNKKKIELKPRNIVAKKDAMITYIEASNGEIVKKKKDYVKKGDIIISGTIMNKNRETKKVPAIGNVLGEIWYKISIEMPINYEKKKLTGRKKNTISLIFLNKELTFDIKKYKNYSFKENKLFVNNLLPIKLVIREKREEKVIKKIYNINNINEDALKIGRRKFKNNKIIYEKVLKKTLNKSKIIIEMFFKVEEDITMYEEITNLELREDVLNE